MDFLINGPDIEIGSTSHILRNHFKWIKNLNVRGKIFKWQYKEISLWNSLRKNFKQDLKLQKFLKEDLKNATILYVTNF